MNTPQTATIYIRATSDDLVARQRTLQAQEAQCRAYCETQGWVVSAVHSDCTHLRKGLLPGWKQVLAEASQRRVSRLVVQRVDRLGRDLQSVVTILSHFRGLGVAILSPNGQCFTDDEQFEITREMAALVPGRISRKHRS